jgi:hypothetical protein
MSSNTDERIDSIVNGLGQVLRIAIQHQQAAEESIKELNIVLADLSQKVKAIEGKIQREIQTSVNQEIGKSLEASAKDVFKALLEKFEAAMLVRLQKHIRKLLNRAGKLLRYINILCVLLFGK